MEGCTALHKILAGTPPISTSVWHPSPTANYVRAPARRPTTFAPQPDGQLRSRSRSRFSSGRGGILSYIQKEMHRLHTETNSLAPTA